MSHAEADMAIRFGASAIGLVGRMPSGPGIISDELIHKIAAAVPPPVATFLLSSETTTDGIFKHHQRVQTNTIQIVDTPEISVYQHLRRALPFIKLVQVIHVRDEHSIETALQVAEHVDALLLDSGNPNLKIKELGGTGRVHNWELSRKIRQQVKKPVFLAGGITKDNVGYALETVGPFGIDVCSGVRSNGKLDERKLEQFIKAIFA